VRRGSHFLEPRHRDFVALLAPYTRHHAAPYDEIGPSRADRTPLRDKESRVRGAGTEQPRVEAGQQPDLLRGFGRRDRIQVCGSDVGLAGVPARWSAIS
jgi:hypothetical protein